MSTAVLVDDWRTVAECALVVGTSREALNMYIWKHNIQVKFVGNTRVVRLRSFEGYTTKAGHVFRYEHAN